MHSSSKSSIHAVAKCNDFRVAFNTIVYDMPSTSLGQVYCGQRRQVGTASIIFELRHVDFVSWTPSERLHNLQPKRHSSA